MSASFDIGWGRKLASPTFAAASAVALFGAPAIATPDGWDHTIKPPSREEVFTTPYAVLEASNQGADARERRDVAIRSDGKGQVMLDVTLYLTRATNPAISTMETRYTLVPARTRGWQVIDAKQRWLCRATPKAGWQWRAESCAGAK